MDAVEYLKQKKRMTGSCESLPCASCPLDDENNKRGVRCVYLEHEYPEEAIAIVRNWAEEHPAKTYRDVFLDHFPNAEMSNDGCGQTPFACLWHIFGREHRPEICTRRSDICVDCWNREVKE